MKRIIYIFIVAIVLFSSCDRENELQFIDLGTEFVFSNSGMTSLDDDVTIVVTNKSTNLSEVSLTHLGGTNADDDSFDAPSSSLGVIPISGETGSIVITDAQLGMSEMDWSVDFQLDAVFDSKGIVRYGSLTIDNPISTEDPHISHRNDTTYHFIFAVAPVSAVVTGVTVETKLFYDGVYAVEAGTFDVEEDSLAIPSDQYNVGDTLYVKVTATTGTKTATELTKLVISPKSLDGINTFTIDNTTDLAYDFLEHRYVESTLAFADSSDIQFTAQYTSSIVEVGFIALNNAEFVVGTLADYANADIVDIDLTDFSTPITSDLNVEDDDVFIFRTKRGTGEYSYGIMKAINVDKPQGVLEDSSIEFEYKYMKKE